ncbi:YL1 nuclear protein-domain-containing protein [Phycomyces nitens]|nr:YL1 nuclear protein-domain-containing protein [Phycomyces nitens]
MSLVLERSRRDNAGSRMRFLISKEVEMEELFEDNESDDEEFHTKLEDEPEDVLDSDFDIDSSEGEAEHEDQANREEKNIAEEERRARRSLFRHDRPQTQSALAQKPIHKTHTIRKPREKISFAESMSMPRVRHSSRVNTVLNRIQVEEQLRENELRKSLLPKRDRPLVRHLTQEELLAEAAITEEKNLESLEQWQLMEADRRARSKKKDKKAMQGPLVRFHSVTDGKPDERPKHHKLVLICSDEDGKNVQSEIVDPVAIAWQTKRDIDESEMVGRNLISFLSELPPKQEDKNEDEEDEDDEDQIDTSGLTDKELDRLDLISELESWAEKEPKPLKPASCLITGLPAIYRDPGTMVPFSNKDTFGIIRACENHEMRWSPKPGIYLGRLTGAAGVPDGWDRMMAGKRKGDPDWVDDNGNPAYPSWMTARADSTRRSLDTRRSVDSRRRPDSPVPSTSRRTRQRSNQTTSPHTDEASN